MIANGMPGSSGSVDREHRRIDVVELDAQLAARQGGGLAERSDGARRIARGVDRVDRRASPSQQFDQAEVLVVAAVGDVEELAAQVVLARSVRAAGRSGGRAA